MLIRAGHFKRDDLASLVRAMKGVEDFSVASAAAALLPIIGTDFIQHYLESTELFETGGMGGPKRPLIQEMALQALSEFKRSKSAGKSHFPLLKRLKRYFNM